MPEPGRRSDLSSLTEQPRGLVELAAIHSAAVVGEMRRLEAKYTD